MSQFETLTNKIIEHIDSSDTLPWSKPWEIRYDRDTNTLSGVEKNLATGKYYRGINTTMLSWVRAITPTYRPFWLGYGQCTTLKIKVNKGSKGQPIFYPKIVKDVDNPDRTKLIGFGVSYVFNIADTDYDLTLLDVKDTTEDINPVETISVLDSGEQIIKGYNNCPPIKEEGNRACYSPTYDKISMPNRDQFKTLECYYKTLFHELIHSTGHRTRLARSGIVKFDTFGSDQYSYEELIAEFGSVFITSITGMQCNTDDLRNSAAYIQGWKKKIKEDPMILPKAAGAAEKAVKYILNNNNLS